MITILWVLWFLRALNINNFVWWQRFTTSSIPYSFSTLALRSGHIFGYHCDISDSEPQYSHLITRRCREHNIYAELQPCTLKIVDLHFKPKGALPWIVCEMTITICFQESSSLVRRTLFTIRILLMSIPLCSTLEFLSWVSVMGSRCDNSSWELYCFNWDYRKWPGHWKEKWKEANIENTVLLNYRSIKSMKETLRWTHYSKDLGKKCRLLNVLTLFPDRHWSPCGLGLDVARWPTMRNPSRFPHHCTYQNSPFRCCSSQLQTFLRHPVSSWSNTFS